MLFARRRRLEAMEKAEAAGESFWATHFDQSARMKLRGKYLARSSFRRLVWLPAIQRVGLDGLRVHDLRHTAATLAAAAGATAKELMERMGHTSPRVALRYQHVMADRQAALAAALDDLARDATRAGPAQVSSPGTRLTLWLR
jgi:integrase